MKKTTIALAVAIASLTTVAAANAAPMDDTWYLGGKVGWSSFHHTKHQDAEVNSGSTKANRTGAGIFAGYQINPYLAFELGWDWLDRMKYTNTNTGNEAKYTLHGGQLVAKLSYPVMEDLDIYTRLGGFVWDGKSKYNGKKKSDNGISPLTAVGVEYAITKNIATRLDYQWVYRAGDKDTVGVRPDNGLLSVGMTYHFGQEQAAKPQAVDLAATPHRFVLNNEVLFDFNKPDLKAEGKAALDKLYGELTALHPTEGKFIVIGHTDRIGSDKYNSALSKKRANSVMKYLVSKGIPETSISSRGVGKSNPVTGTTCNALKGSKLRACLAPDRRVEIEITGTHEMIDHKK